MTSTQNAAQAALAEGRRDLEWCRCWSITRKDGVTLYFTEHDVDVAFAGNTYSPLEGIDGSAVERLNELNPMNFEVTGVVSDGRVSAIHLAGGLYRDALVQEYLVNWRYPDILGAFKTEKFWVDQVGFDGEAFSAQVSGITRWLEQSFGTVLDRRCRYDLFDSRCTLVKATYTTAARTITQISGSYHGYVLDSRQTFRTNHHGDGDGYYDLGPMTWVTGDNAGLEFEIETYDENDTNTDSVVRLQLRTGAAVQLGDTFTMSAGCDKLANTCQTKFLTNNFVNFGGFPFMPGEDDVVRKVGDEQL